MFSRMVGAALYVVVLFQYGWPAVSSAQSGPTAQFDWSMPERLGKSLDDRGILRVAATMSYPQGYAVFPATWPLWDVVLDGSPSQSANGIVSYTWKIDDGPEHGTTSPRFETTLAEGSHTVTLTVRDSSGTSASTTKDITVKDIVIVSMGDSFASGQGNPDQYQVWDGSFVKKGPQWIDQRCARSAHAGAVQAALRRERSDPHTSVTFIFVACSGATITATDDMTGGLLDPYRGQLPGPMPNPPKLLPQVDEAKLAVCPSKDRCRTVNEIIISAGGNDIGFADIVARCIVADGSAMADPAEKLHHNAVLHPLCFEDPNFIMAVNAKIDGLDDKYRRLGARLRELFPGSFTVFLTEYPDPTHDASGHYCGLNGPRLMDAIDYKSAKYASEGVITRLNAKVKQAATQFIPNGVYVSDISAHFMKHGGCAGEERWFLTSDDAYHRQGPWIGKNPLALTIDQKGWASNIMSGGMVHPNEKGHQAYASAIYAYMLNKNHQPSSMPATPDPVTPGEKLATANQAQALAVQIAQLKSEAEQRGMEIDFETDRLGMDYRTFTAAQPLHCTEECAQDPQCEAYSYALPGTLGPEGRCWLKHEQPSPNRRPGFVSGAKVMVGKTMKLLEVNTDRPGMDYRSFEAANPKACQLACANETECKAFTFAPPGVVQAAGYCWLKSGRPDPIDNNRLVSGVKERTSDDFNYKDPGIELSTDRPGMDYRALETPQLQVCQLACLNDEQCKSFTFAPAGVVGATGYCWLKSGRPAPVVNNRLISGTKPLSADERRAK